MRYDVSRKTPRVGGTVACSPSRCASADASAPIGCLPLPTCASCDGSPSRELRDEGGIRFARVVLVEAAEALPALGHLGLDLVQEMMDRLMAGAQHADAFARDQ